MRKISGVIQSSKSKSIVSKNVPSYGNSSLSKTVPKETGAGCNPISDRLDTTDHRPLDPTKFRREFKGKQPLPASTMRGQGFGRPDLDRSFFVEKSIDQAVFFILKYQWLDDADRHALCEVAPQYRLLSATIERFRFHDFSPVAEPNPDYATQASIPRERIDNFVACLIHYDMDMGSVIRYAGGNYLATHRDPTTILSHIRDIVPDDVFADCQRLLTSGAPATIQGDVSLANIKAFRAYGNHRSIRQHLEKVNKTMNKEERNNFVIPLYWWLTFFIINHQLSPQGYLVKPDKKDRLLFDASHRPYPWCQALNDITHKRNEPELVFGHTFVKNLIRIYNLRITFPLLEILLWDDDASSAFRNIKHHPDIAAAYAFIIDWILYIAVGQTFGSNFSPSNWEPFARARALLAETLFWDDSLVEKHKKYIDKIMFSAPPTPEEVATFVPAHADEFNKGVLDKDGNPVATPHYTFVDDNHMADIERYIRRAIAASIEALFIIVGQPDEAVRKLPLSMDKFYQSMCSFDRVQLGKQVNTRRLVVGLPPQKRALLLKVLREKWHARRRSFVALEAAQLIGAIGDACQVCPWGRFLLLPLIACLKRALRNNRRRLARSRHFNELLNQEDDSWVDPVLCTKRAKNQAITKKVWKCTARTFIDRYSRASLDALEDVYNNPTRYRWECPISLLIPRAPTWRSKCDSSLTGAGGFCLELRLWVSIEWPAEIRARTINSRAYRRGQLKKHDLITINDLEFAMVLIMYLAVITRVKTLVNVPVQPILLNLVDNTSAEAWTTKGCTSSRASMALSRILCGLLMKNDVGLNAGFIKGTDNVEADGISRTHQKNETPNFARLFQEFPQLNCCERFHPSPEFFSVLCSALLSHESPVPTQVSGSGHFSPARTSS